MNPATVWRTGRSVVESFGWTGLRLRTTFEIKRRVGLLHTASSRRVETPSIPPTRWPFALDLAAIAAATDRTVALARAERVANGEHHAYRSEWRSLPSAAHAWSVHPLSGFEYPSDPWPAVYELAAGLRPDIGDVKDVWEPARFGWVFDLIRGYAITGDERFVEAFWTHLESFVKAAPAFRGVHWTCGQETAIRALSCLWAESAFASARASTAARTQRLHQLLLASAERIDDAIEYGVSQRNNHGISESAGLIALGARFLSAGSRARHWLHRGAHWFEHCVHDQFASDGWYLQHSFTYLRLALDQAVVASRVLRLVDGNELSASAKARLAAATRLLIELHDPATGDVPNHGANDGAYVLPVSVRGYRDFRPSITVAAATFDIAVPTDFESCNESLAWIGETVRRSSMPLASMAAGPSGWISVRLGRIRVFARAATYTSRPSHIDPAHVDVWIDGKPVAIDAGTFRYNAPPPWKNGLSAIEVHNTISIPEMPAATRGPRFLWLGRPKARFARCAGSPADGYEIDILNETWSDRGISHRRLIAIDECRVTITDLIEARHGTEDVDVVLHWLIPDHVAPPRIAPPTGATVESERASDTDVFGWVSAEYAQKLPATSMRARARVSSTSDSPLRFVTIFAVPDVSPERDASDAAAR